MRNPTEPSTRNAVTTAPYLPIDLISLQDTHAVRVDRSMKRQGAWRQKHVRAVRRGVREWLRHQDLPADYPVPVYWLHDWLAYGPLVGPRTPKPQAAWEARLTLVYALNQPNSGLELVLQRRIHQAS